MASLPAVALSVSLPLVPVICVLKELVEMVSSEKARNSIRRSVSVAPPPVTVTEPSLFGVMV